MSMRRLETLLRRTCAAAAAAVLLAALPAAMAAEPATTDVRAIAAELRKGGYVVFFRHAPTETTGATDEAADLKRCETQRNLSAEGRAQASTIGRAFKALRIPVGQVLASPFCRTKDTARLAFGRFTVNTDLLFVIDTEAAETKRLSESLRTMLATPPAPGTNTILVSHSANLREAAGIFAKPEGAAYVFRPVANGRFETVARLLPQDWQAAAEQARP